MEHHHLLRPYHSDFWGDRFFNQLMPREFHDFFRTGNLEPSVDLRETDKELILQADIPGLNPEDLDITVDDDKITLKGETRRDEDREEKGYHLTERRYGSFYRTIPLPVQVKSENAVARYQNGVLKLTIPKAEANAHRGYKPRIETDNHPTH